MIISKPYQKSNFKILFAPLHLCENNATQRRRDAKNREGIEPVMDKYI